MARKSQKQRVELKKVAGKVLEVEIVNTQVEPQFTIFNRPVFLQVPESINGDPTVWLEVVGKGKGRRFKKSPEGQVVELELPSTIMFGQKTRRLDSRCAGRPYRTFYADMVLRPVRVHNPA